MIGKYTVKQVRDIGLAGFGAASIFTGAIANPVMIAFAAMMAIGAGVAVLNRMPDMIAELNGGIQVLRGRF
jgi:4-hydroxybenzoate polyprenyltransferase